MKNIILTPIKNILSGLLGLAVIVIGGWCSLAISYSNFPVEWLRTMGALGFAFWTLATFGSLGRWSRAHVYYAGGIALVVVWWLTIPPSHDRDWAIDVAVLPRASVDGDRVSFVVDASVITGCPNQVAARVVLEGRVVAARARPD